MKSVRAQELLGWNHGTVRVGKEKCKMFTKEKSSSSIPSSFGSFPSGKGVSQHLHQAFNKGLVPPVWSPVPSWARPCSALQPKDQLSLAQALGLSPGVLPTRFLSPRG